MRPAGAIPPKTYANFYTNPRAAALQKSTGRFYLPLGQKGDTMTATVTIPDSQTVSIRTKQIGDTLLVIESAVSTDARETAYNKIKRLILDHADRCDQPPRAA